ncbi:hypothetical protein SAMN05421820_101272 [Pedobacter steynii]|uniref:Uncharacterized protein n=1 Tax=Pedobacter steynii TaxID=430522 RepID=A0A1G9JI29_9SPHI|nr:hypothetical protein [Pedobacter steynii]NQX38259.1 hypothetical protein [Pedobacter steynii]SDL37250.1 hypothetical protein SAMN05421820_101272 [Pedobacter steynii]
MKITLLLGFIFLNNVVCTDANTVYICDSGTGKRYHHTADCRGLNNCQHKVIKTTLEIAKSKGKTLCGWED